MTDYQYRIIMSMLWLIVLFLTDDFFMAIMCSLFSISYLIRALVSEIKKERNK